MKLRVRMITNWLLNVLGVTKTYGRLKNRTVQTTYDAVDILFKGGVLILFIFTFIFVSIFLYIVFYYTYVPSIEHVKSVHFQFDACEKMSSSTWKAVCSFPKANVQFTTSNQLLMVGQEYKIGLQLEVPESDVNKHLGMFLVCASLYGGEGLDSYLVAHSCRSSMLRYRSPLLQALRMLALSPLYIFGFVEEKQTLSIELFSHFIEDQKFPVTRAQIEIKTEKLEVYSSKIQIDAHLTGLKYAMFHWPVLSALTGGLFNLGVIASVGLLSWIKLYSRFPDVARFLFGSDGNEPLEGGPFLLLDNDQYYEAEEEEEENGERKFVLERKLSSSEA